MVDTEYSVDDFNFENSMYSPGTGIALDSLLKNFHKYSHGLVMINIGTLLRNLIVKDSTVQTVFEAFASELPSLLNEVSELLRTTTSINKPLLFLYSVNYPKCLDVEHLRKPSKSRMLLFDCIHYINLHSTRLFGDKHTGNVNGVEVLYKHISKPKIPIADQLYHQITSCTLHRRAIMLSHTAIDFHLVNRLTDMVLLESHTGKWKKPHTINTKVFGSAYESVPFYPITHMCLGDKDIVKPTMSISQKKELIALAIKDKWRSKSERHVNMMIDLKFHITPEV